MNNQPIFEQIHGLEVIYENPHQPVIYSGSDAGLFVSRDEGRSWVNALEKSGLINSSAVTALKALRFADRNILLLAGAYGGIFLSANLGAAWEVVSFGKPSPVITAFCASQGNYLHAATLADGVYTSTDNGKHWVRWNFGLLDWRVYSIAASIHPDGTSNDGTSILFAGTESGIYASKNNGRTWRETTFPDSCGAVLALSGSPDGKTLFAGTEAGIIYCSKDNGMNWEKVYEDSDGAEISAILTYQSAEGEGICAAACGSRIVFTSDDGKNWQAWYSSTEAESSSITALSAPLGMQKGSPLWGARDDGSVFQMIIP